MKKIILFIFCFSLLSIASFAQDFQNHVMPSIGFNALQTGEKAFVLTPSVNLHFMRMKNEGVESSQPDFIMAGAGYSQSCFTCGIGPDQIKRSHGCNLMFNLAKEKNSFMAMLSAGGELPFSNIKTVTGGVMYSRKIVDKENLSFDFGGGVIVADLGLKIAGHDIYVIPLPVFSFTYKNDYLSGTIAVMGPPRIEFKLFPESKFRFNSSLGMMNVRSIRDLTFDCAFAYYPLHDTDKGDMLSLSLGVMNNQTSVVLKDADVYGYQYYSVYGEVNATIVKLRAGYNFDGKAIVKDEFTGEIYKGFFASLNAMWMF